MPTLTLHTLHTEVNYDQKSVDGWTKPYPTLNCLISPQEVVLTMDARINGEAMGAASTSQTAWTSSTLEPPSTCLQEQSQVSADTAPTRRRTAVTV